VRGCAHQGAGMKEAAESRRRRRMAACSPSFTGGASGELRPWGGALWTRLRVAHHLAKMASPDSAPSWRLR
jgi:hypothetical protein